MLEVREALADYDIASAERLWQGPLLERFVLPGVPLWEQWLEEQGALERTFSDVLRASANAALRAGDVPRACALMQRATEVQPWSIVVRLMTLRDRAVQVLPSHTGHRSTREPYREAHGL